MNALPYKRVNRLFCRIVALLLIPLFLSTNLVLAQDNHSTTFTLAPHSIAQIIRDYEPELERFTKDVTPSGYKTDADALTRIRAEFEARHRGEPDYEARLRDFETAYSFRREWVTKTSHLLAARMVRRVEALGGAITIDDAEKELIRQICEFAEKRNISRNRRDALVDAISTEFAQLKTQRASSGALDTKGLAADMAVTDYRVLEEIVDSFPTEFQDKRSRLDAARRLKELPKKPVENLYLAETEVNLHIGFDGSHSATWLVYDEWRRGLKAIAVIDRNSMEHIEEALEAGEIFGIEVIPAVEFATSEEGINILAYFPNLNRKTFKNWYEYINRNWNFFDRSRTPCTPTDRIWRILAVGGVPVLADLSKFRAKEGVTDEKTYRAVENLARRGVCGIEIGASSYVHPDRGPYTKLAERYERRYPSERLVRIAHSYKAVNDLKTKSAELAESLPLKLLEFELRALPAGTSIDFAATAAGWHVTEEAVREIAKKVRSGMLGLQINIDGIAEYLEVDLYHILKPEDIDIVGITGSLIEGGAGTRLLGSDDIENLSIDRIVRVAQRGDRTANAAIKKAAERIGNEIFNMIAVLGGKNVYLGTNNKALEGPLIEAVSQHLNKDLKVDAQSYQTISVRPISEKPDRPVALAPARTEVTLEGKTAVGVDIGGTNIKVVIFKDGKLLDSNITLTLAESRTPEEVLDAAKVQMYRLLEKNGLKLMDVDAVGVCTPGMRDAEGHVTYMPGFPNRDSWVGVSLRDIVPPELRGIAFEATKDGNAAGVAENYAHNVGDNATYTIGTGIGGSLVINGEVLNGENANAATMGHIIVGEDSGYRYKPRTEGRRGAVGDVASASAIGHYAQQKIRERGLSAKDTLILKLAGGDVAKVTAKEVCEAALEGDALALEILNKAAGWVARAIYRVSLISGVKTHVIGGGISEGRDGDLFVKLVKRRLPRNIRVVKSVLGEYGPAIGSAILAVKKQVLLAKAMEKARDAVVIEASAVAGLKRQIKGDFAKAVETIFEATSKGKKVVITGIGKPGHIGRKLEATFNSLGTRAQFLDPAEAWHGDMGMIADGDVVIAISNSGNTEEVNRLIPRIRRFGAKLVALTGNVDSELAKAADFVLNSHVEKEADPLNLAPTASSTAALALGDALAVALEVRRGFGAADFAILHPGRKTTEAARTPISETGPRRVELKTVVLSEMLKKAREAISIEANSVRALKRRLNRDFAQVIEAIYAATQHGKKVVITGGGKQGHIARKLEATFNSLGTRAQFLDAAEAWRGDMGMISFGDVVIAISNSGEEKETNRLIRHMDKERFGATIVALTGDVNSELAKLADYVLDSHVKKEADTLNLAPTASSTAALALGDALAIALEVRRGFRRDDFGKFHPGGRLGDATRIGESARTVVISPFLSIRELKYARKLMARDTSSNPAIEIIKKNKIFAVVTKSITKPERAKAAARAAIAGGIRLIEVTLTTPGSLDIIRDLRKEFAARPDILIGAGSARTVAEAQKAIDAGAQFIFSPIFDKDVVRLAKLNGIPIGPGTRSDQETREALAAGMDFAKVYPAFFGDGQSYIEALRGAMPETYRYKIVPVTQTEAIGKKVVTTPTEIWNAMQRTPEGETIYVLPPSEKGIPWLTRLSNELPGVPFIPTAGISLKNLTEVLGIKGVAAVGLGSAIYPIPDIDKGDYENVTAAARAVLEKAGIQSAAKEAFPKPAAIDTSAETAIQEVQALTDQITKVHMPLRAEAAIDTKNIVIVAKRGLAGNITGNKGTLSDLLPARYQVLEQDMRRVFSNSKNIVEVDTTEDLVTATNDILANKALKVIIMDDGSLTKGLDRAELEAKIHGQAGVNYCAIVSSCDEMLKKIEALKDVCPGIDLNTVMPFVNFNAMAMMGTAILSDDHTLFEIAYKLFTGEKEIPPGLVENQRLTWFVKALPRIVRFDINQTHDQQLLNKLFTAAA